MLEQAVRRNEVGKLGCEHCMYWKEYGAINLELYGFVGRWGRCINEETAKELNTKTLSNNTTTKDRTQTHINRLGINMQILSTCPTYSCSRMKIPVDKKTNNTGTTIHDDTEESTKDD